MVIKQMIFDVKTGTKKIVEKELTAEEIAAMEAITEQPTEPTAEERIAALEEELAATKILLGVSE